MIWMDSTLAHAKLVGPTSVYYMQTPSVVIGRLSNQTKDLENFFPVSDANNISRNHAQIEWDATQYRFVIKCLGKNGLTLNVSNILKQNQIALLEHKDKVMMGDASLFFLYPENFPFQKDR